MAGPQLQSSAAGQRPRPDVRVPVELVARDLADQRLGPGRGRRGHTQVTGAQGDGQADHRGDQPAFRLPTGGKALHEAVGGLECGGTRFVPACRQRHRG
jgi:hypothetical protein